MLLLTTVAKAQEKIAKNARLQRLAMGLTQQGLAKRSGVPLPTLRKFEQKGLISNHHHKIRHLVRSLNVFIQFPPSSSITDKCQGIQHPANPPPRFTLLQVLVFFTAAHFFHMAQPQGTLK